MADRFTIDFETFVVDRVVSEARSFGKTIKHLDNGSTNSRRQFTRRELKEVESRFRSLKEENTRQLEELKSSFSHCRQTVETDVVINLIERSISSATSALLWNGGHYRETMGLVRIDQIWIGWRARISGLILRKFGVEYPIHYSQYRVDVNWKEKLEAFQALAQKESREVGILPQEGPQSNAQSAKNEKEWLTQICVRFALLGTLGGLREKSMVIRAEGTVQHGYMGRSDTSAARVPVVFRSGNMGLAVAVEAQASILEQDFVAASLQIVFLGF
ncbi:uncharacterized protein B0I36DRAFT_356219 [Microdochium trichocladiopsis]|uniref:Uncharacterized protein n=1 Tax=Microdochium trichocladiopsis TaxID=1682393 RepID=A0A9P9BHP4_9PEZI|nr:uncharacterized protein B0I36DRAFT_356219 [Microdochium trichocladiopsis]KAH7012121.1 hypothetical protein B0I36DRAFT_356219 [Microdochium trichocladiopsis]